MATTIAANFALPEPYAEEYLPESDGRPMAETDVHRRQMIDLLETLDEYFRDDPQVYVTGNIFLYFRDEAGARQSVSPDIFVVRGVEKKLRRIYNLDVEQKPPELVIELTSINTKVEDFGNKRFIYANFGVKEYFLFDPFSETMRPALRGFRLQGGDYAPMAGTHLPSEVLGMDLVLEENQLRLYDRKTGNRLRTRRESEVELRAERAARHAAEVKAEAAATARKAAETKAAEAAAARKAAETKAAEAAAARHAAEAKAVEAAAARNTAEAEVARLREQLARLRGD